jgi:hypothetical protein
MSFVPNFFLFLVILIAGYFLARVVARLLNRGLHRVGFDRLVERGGIKQIMERAKWTPSDVVGVIIFWTIFLFVLELAFSVFGPNPISAIILSIISYLPNLFAAILIVIVAAAVAAAAKQILQATLGGFSYGRALANTVSAIILVIGVFAALDQLGIAPAIVLGLFYAMLAVVVGSAVISIGVGGIQPMRRQWEKVLGKVEAEAPNLKAAAATAGERAPEPGQPWQPIAAQQAQPEEHEQELAEKPRFPTQP